MCYTVETISDLEWKLIECVMCCINNKVIQNGDFLKKGVSLIMWYSFDKTMSEKMCTRS